MALVVDRAELAALADWTCRDPQLLSTQAVRATTDTQYVMHKIFNW